MNSFAGIDYGSKRSGNTVICYLKEQELQFLQAPKKADADQFILDAANNHRWTQVFLDAPLSLPGVYHKQKGKTNYHYRTCDQEIKAMSPMFLGGLTARAMELKSKLDQLNMSCHEAYPGGLAKLWDLQAFGYAKSGPIPESLLQNLSTLSPCQFRKPENWHQIDALLAWFIGFRFNNNEAKIIGDPLEGCILV